MNRRRAPVLLAALFCAPAAALDFSFGELTGAFRGQVSLGAAMRMQGRDEDLIGKLNLPGQEQFCEDKAPPLVDGVPNPVGTAPGMNCQTVEGNAAYLALPGYANVNFDNGDLNYDKGDLVSAAVKVSPRLQLTWREYGLDLSGLYFYDAINENFEETHPNNFGNGGFQPEHTRRPDSASNVIGSRFQLLNAYVSAQLPLPGERQLSLKVGNQVLSLGTSTLLVFNGLNTVNPPDVAIRLLPGSDVRDVFVRVPLAMASTNITEALALTGFYQFRWEPTVLPPIGSFFSANDLIGGGDPYVVALFGKYREDPMNQVGVQERTQGNANLLSDAGRTLYPGPEKKPSHQGQYGFNASYFFETLNGTSVNLTYLNLHSRFPLIGFIAAEEGCAHDATNQVEAVTMCEGFRPPPLHAGRELVTIDSVKFFFEYPENIHALGTSFSTNLGAVAWTGEIVYRPNQPFQIDANDLGFAALQPIFPADNITYGGVGPIPAITIPARRTAAPDYVETSYRGHTVQPGQTIPGYERLKAIAYNTSFLFLQGASENWFAAEQMTTLLEIGAFHVLNMPKVDELQFAASGTQFHHSAGVDSTGTPTPEQQATDPGNRLNPSYQADGFATAFSYGYRVLNQLTYEDVLPGLRVLPQLVWFHDIGGRSPLPTGEFVAGRKQATAGVSVNYGAHWSGSLRYTWYFGGGRANNLADRDNLAATLNYDF
jgi:hypothetical protein